MKAARWRKSSYSGANTQSGCVEIANTLDQVRDSKQPDGPALHVNVRGLVRAIQAGRLNE